MTTGQGAGLATTQASDARATHRVVLITGAAGGIGSVLVDAFRANGDLVVAADVEHPHDAARGADGSLAIALDVTDEDQCSRLATRVRDVYGRLEVVVHCAGSMPISAFENISSAGWRSALEINLTGPFLVTRAVLPLLREAGWGRLIFMGSGTFFRGTPNQAHYISAKAGLVGLSRCLSTELGSFGITSNVITPGITLTAPIQRDFTSEELVQRRAGRSIQRDMYPTDLVGATMFLGSPGSDFITGQIINVDGGNNKH